MIYRARFSMDFLCRGRILGPKNTLNPVCRHLSSRVIIPCVILPFARSILSTLCRSKIPCPWRGIFAPGPCCRRMEKRKTCRFRGSPPQADLKPKYEGGDEILVENPQMSVWRQPHPAPPLDRLHGLCKRLTVPSIHND